MTVKLEDRAYAIVATTTTDSQGRYAFENVTISGTGLNVLFAQEWNEQYDVSDVVSWAWMGPITIPRGNRVQVADLEISLLGFEPVAPPSGASFSKGEISAEDPLTFEWTPYPGAGTYWVDLTQGDDLNRVWQSALVSTTSVAFDGVLNGGIRMPADTYWWGVGACKDVEDYQLTIYGYLPTFTVGP